MFVIAYMFYETKSEKINNKKNNNFKAIGAGTFLSLTGKMLTF